MGTQHYGTSNITMRALLLLVAIIAASSAAPMSSGFARNDAVVPETRFVTTRETEYCHSGGINNYKCTGTLVALGSFGSGSECREACKTYAAEQTQDNGDYSDYHSGIFCCTYKNDCSGSGGCKCRISPGDPTEGCAMQLDMSLGGSHCATNQNWKSWQYNPNRFCYTR